MAIFQQAGREVDGMKRTIIEIDGATWMWTQKKRHWLLWQIKGVHIAQCLRLLLLRWKYVGEFKTLTELMQHIKGGNDGEKSI